MPRGLDAGCPLLEVLQAYEQHQVVEAVPRGTSPSSACKRPAGDGDVSATWRSFGFSLSEGYEHLTGSGEYEQDFAVCGVARA